MARRGKTRRKGGIGARFLQGDGFLGEVMGNALGQFIAERLDRRLERSEDEEQRSKHDIAAHVLRSLDAKGKQTIAQLPRATRTTLRELLGALDGLEKWGLVNATARGVINLTALGRDAVSTLAALEAEE